MTEEFNPFEISGNQRIKLIDEPSVAAEERAKRKPANDKPVENEASSHLRAFVERIERLEEEKKEVAGFIKDVFGEAKAMGFDTKALKKIIALRRMDPDERAEQDAILDTYLAALGMLPDA